MSHQHCEPEFKKKLVRLHLEEGRTLQSLSVEYCVAKASITIKKFLFMCRLFEVSIGISAVWQR